MQGFRSNGQKIESFVNIFAILAKLIFASSTLLALQGSQDLSRLFPILDIFYCHSFISLVFIGYRTIYIGGRNIWGSRNSTTQIGKKF